MKNNLHIPSSEHEREYASNGYIMSLVAIMAGLPIPVVNLIASVIFYLANRKATYFVRWHATQSLLSQLSVVAFNSTAFWWTISIFFLNEKDVDNDYIAYVVGVVTLNLFELIGTIIAAIKVRKGIHYRIFIIGEFTDMLVKQPLDEPLNDKSVVENVEVESIVNELDI